MDTLTDTLNTKIQKLDAFRQEHARLVFLNRRVNELDVLIGSDTNPANLDIVERDVLIPLRKSTLDSYQKLEKELDDLGLLEKTAFEEKARENEQVAHMLSGEASFTKKEIMGLWTCGIFTVAGGWAIIHLAGGYLNSVFGF